MTERKNPLGPVGHALRERIAAGRKAHRLTYKELSDRITATGRHIPVLGLSRIEAGERRVDADDLVAIAAALAVPVPVLLGLTDSTDSGCKNCNGQPPPGYTCSACGVHTIRLSPQERNSVPPST
jgi:transcriptional regulator with XRE-family HTH domain